jgi:hypothetical protein
MSSTGVAAGALPADASDGAAREGRADVRVLTLAAVVFAALTTVAYVCTISWTHPIPRDATTLVVGRDFLNSWMYGRAAWLPDPSRFYDPRLYNDALSGLVGSDYPAQNWSYPPSIMLLTAPFGRLGYFPALLIWTVLGLGIFVWVARRRIGDYRLLVPIMLSPAAIFCLMSGQSSFLTVAILLTIFACYRRRPTLAGILIGVLSLKPQLGLLFPVMLIAAGRWRVFAVAAATTVAIVALTAALFGPQVWIDFVVKGLPVQNLVLADPERVGTPFYPTVFMNVRGADASYAVAMAVQLCFSAFAVGAVFYAFRFRRNADRRLLAALFFACMICGVPYLLAYDTLAATCLAVMLLATGGLGMLGATLAKLVYWLPLIQIGLGQFHVPGPALIAPAFAAYLLMRLIAAGEDKAASAPLGTAAVSA